jgi:hypothetical protein
MTTCSGHLFVMHFAWIGAWHGKVISSILFTPVPHLHTLHTDLHRALHDLAGTGFLPSFLHFTMIRKCRCPPHVERLY